MDSKETPHAPLDDKIAPLVTTIINYRPLHPFYTYTALLCYSIGGLSSIIRWHNGWTYEDAGLWLNLGFWGGYLIGIFVFGPILVLALINDRRFDKAVREVKREKARRALEPSVERTTNVFEDSEKHDSL